MGNGDFTIEGFMYIDDPNLGGGFHNMISKNGSTFNTDTSWFIRTNNYNGIDLDGMMVAVLQIILFRVVLQVV